MEDGFRFQESEGSVPALPGDDPAWLLRLETAASGWWLVPVLGVEIASDSAFTSALQCGPGADQDCIDVRVAQASGCYSAAAEMLPEYSYVLTVLEGGSNRRYSLIRITHLGFSQDGAIALFDWAFQL